LIPLLDVGRFFVVNTLRIIGYTDTRHKKGLFSS
jgi:hypothetical protein